MMFTSRGRPVHAAVTNLDCMHLRRIVSRHATTTAAKSGPSALKVFITMTVTLATFSQVVRELTEAGAFTALTDSLDGALARIEGRPAPKRNKRPYSSLED
eukprot:1019135-Pleurochrysis_carterae.AAC.1